MVQVLRIVAYILKNNPWYQWPYRIFVALCYQCRKRVFKTVLSKRLFNGNELLLFPKNPICSAFVYANIPDKEEILSLRLHADKDTIFLDVGANVGSYSLLLADIVKSVYAFEAHPQTAKLCKMNFLLNGLDENQVICSAVSNDLEPVYFSNSDAGSPTNAQISSNDGITVPCVTLDSFVHEQHFSPNQSFILKIDVEGFEHAVFEGASQLLKTYPVKAIIFERFSSQNKVIMQELEQLGFAIRPIGTNNLLAFKKEDRCDRLAV